MQMKITLDNFPQVEKRLTQNLKPGLDRAVFETSGFLENRRTKYMKERIYDQEASENYTRSGAALGGAYNKSIGDMRRQVVSDARLKRNKNNKKNINYTPFLNRNKKIARFNTHFWDDAVKDTFKESQTILKRNVSL